MRATPTRVATGHFGSPLEGEAVSRVVFHARDLPRAVTNTPQRLIEKVDAVWKAGVKTVRDSEKSSSAGNESGVPRVLQRLRPGASRVCRDGLQQYQH